MSLNRSEGRRFLAWVLCQLSSAHRVPCMLMKHRRTNGHSSPRGAYAAGMASTGELEIAPAFLRTWAAFTCKYACGEYSIVLLCGIVVACHHLMAKIGASRPEMAIIIVWGNHGNP